MRIGVQPHRLPLLLGGLTRSADEPLDVGLLLPLRRKGRLLGHRGSLHQLREVIHRCHDFLLGRAKRCPILHSGKVSLRDLTQRDHLEAKDLAPGQELVDMGRVGQHPPDRCLGAGAHDPVVAERATRPLRDGRLPVPMCCRLPRAPGEADQRWVSARLDDRWLGRHPQRGR